MNRSRVCVLGAVLAAAGALGACGSDEQPSAEATSTVGEHDHPEGVAAAAVGGNADPGDAVSTIHVDVVAGLPDGGAQRHKVPAGDVVLIEVTLDIAEEVHLHGYDYTVEGEAGDTVQIAFVANVPGIWEVELEAAGVQLLELEVS